jgi:hypothetical protein
LLQSGGVPGSCVRPKQACGISVGGFAVWRLGFRSVGFAV